MLIHAFRFLLAEGTGLDPRPHHLRGDRRLVANTPPLEVRQSAAQQR
jgi:hypothetical protein